MKGVAVIVVVWVTELQIVPNWRRCRINRRQILAGGIILQILQLIIRILLYKLWIYLYLLPRRFIVTNKLGKNNQMI